MKNTKQRFGHRVLTRPACRNAPFKGRPQQVWSRQTEVMARRQAQHCPGGCGLLDELLASSKWLLA